MNRWLERQKRWRWNVWLRRSWSSSASRSSSVFPRSVLAMKAVLLFHGRWMISKDRRFGLLSYPGEIWGWSDSCFCVSGRWCWIHDRRGVLTVLECSHDLVIPIPRQNEATGPPRHVTNVMLPDQTDWRLLLHRHPLLGALWHQKKVEA